MQGKLRAIAARGLLTGIAAILLKGGALADPAAAREAIVPPLPEATAPVPVLILSDLASGQIIAERRIDLPFAPASMTKVMTLYVAFEELKAGRLQPRTQFPVPVEIAREWRGKGTSMFLAAGETVPLDALLHGIATASANDAAVVIAVARGGSVPGWSAMMNRQARMLGMSRSRFNTPNGWPDEGRTYVTARDLVTLGQALIARHPGLYRHYFGRREMVWNGMDLRSHDPVSGIVAGADGIKTGHTREAGYNFLGSAQRDGRRLVMVIGGAHSEAERREASRALLEWGFAEWKSVPIFARGAIVSRARVQGGKARHVALAADRAIRAAVPRRSGGRLSLRLRYDGPLIAPIRKGARVATLEIRVDGMAPGRVPLYAARDVAKAGIVDRIANALARWL